jgi:hypothetical protein
MREFRTSGSVRGEGGNILAYSASGTRALKERFFEGLVASARPVN